MPSILVIPVGIVSILTGEDNFTIPTGIMKITVGIGPSIDISIAGEDTPGLNGYTRVHSIVLTKSKNVRSSF